MRWLLQALVMVAASVSLAADATLSAAEAQIVKLSNQERARLGLPLLESDSTLAQVSRGHSEEMARLNFFEHESPTPGRREPWDRANLAGVDSEEFGENLFFAEGSPVPKTPGMAVSAWMKSPGHRANLLSPSFTRVGVGLAVYRKQVYVTQMFSNALEPYRPAP